LKMLKSDRERNGRAVPAEVIGVFGEEQLPELIVRPELEVVRLIHLVGVGPVVDRDLFIRSQNVRTPRYSKMPVPTVSMATAAS
jgi:hypothetical protein